jgi:hypothetical protein
MARKKSAVKGIFLSHSSRDKQFVTKLASDLANLGFPVWFDSWELEMGDSLHNKIYEGIDSSSAMILVMSKNSVKSSWVNKELRGALLKEEELKNRFLIPIKLDDCKIPLPVRDRIFADFSSGYQMQLEKLERALRARGADKIELEFTKKLIPLRISKGLYLDEISLQSRITALSQELKAGNQVKTSQFVLYPEQEYEEVRRRVALIIDEVNKGNSHPDGEREFRSTYESLRRLEDRLLLGIAWIVRSALLHRLWQLQSALPEANDFGKDALGLLNYQNAASLFGVDDVIVCDAWKPSTGEYHSFFVDAGSEVGRWFQENPQVPDLLRAFWSPDLMYKYAIPQIVFKDYNGQAPFGWYFTECMIGLH